MAADPAGAAISLDRPAERPAARWWFPAIVVWGAIWAAFFIANSKLVARMEFRDPDDELRLVQVRDLIAGQGWFDLHQYRVDAAGGGVLMHWSRLVDAPIAGLIALLRPMIGQGAAEQVALVAIPALTLLAIVLLVGWMASRTIPSNARVLAMACVAFAAPAMMQLLPMRIDHHGWQIALALGAVAACLDPDQRRGGFLSGAALAAWMAISFEGLPFSAWFVAVLGLLALLDPSARPRLVATMQSLAASSTVLFLATRGIGDLAQHCDAIAPVHLAIFVWGALAIGLPGYLWPKSRFALLGGFAIAGAGALALVGVLAPRCATGTFDMLDPVVRGFWYDNVAEGKPLTGAVWPLIAQYALPPLIALAVAVRLAMRAEGPLKRWWIAYALFLGGALAIGIAVTRAASIAGILAALPLGWLVANRLGALKRPSNPVLRAGELVATAALIFCVLVPAVPVAAIERLTIPPTDHTPEPGTTVACTARHARQAFDALPPGGILAPLDFGPNILANSRMSVLATGHHRGAKAMREVIDAFSGSPDRARSIATRHGLRYVVICPKVQEMALYRERAPNGFAVQLLAGNAPAWLRPVPLPAASGLRMWELAE
jgi:hypothetical protein